jgi:hypothetical protein
VRLCSAVHEGSLVEMTEKVGVENFYEHLVSLDDNEVTLFTNAMSFFMQPLHGLIEIERCCHSNKNAENFFADDSNVCREMD